MKARNHLVAAATAVLLAACGGSSNTDLAVPAPPAQNPGGGPVTNVITARFDPANAVVPFPSNLFFSGTTDLTINVPVANPNNIGDPAVALNALDGFSTVAPWSMTFSRPPAASTIVPGQSVRLFEVTLTGPGGGVTGIVRELGAGTEFVTALSPTDTTQRTLAIVFTRPLKQITSYMAVITNGVADAQGNIATPDSTYFLTKRTSPLIANGVSTDPLLSNAQAQALEPLRQLVNSQEAAAAAAGIARDNIVLSWVATTQSISPTLQTVRATTQPGTVVLRPTGLTIQAAIPQLPPIADIFLGTIELPYFLTAPTAQNPTAPLNTFWRGAPCGQVPSCGQLLGPNNPSTNLTFLNPRPVATGTVTAPLLVTVPNAASGRTRPANGWPVVIYYHGITRNRTDALAISATLASQGFAVISMDQPLHGITDTTNPFYARGPLAQAIGAVASERTFDVDFVNNQTGAPGPDGSIDASGAHFINLASLLTSRDNNRQAIVDPFTLKASIPALAFPPLNVTFDANAVSFVGQSLGAINGGSFVTFEPTIGRAVLSVPGGGIAQMLNGSPTFGPAIRAGLAAAAGLQPGTPQFDQFFLIAQTVIDSADPVNIAAFAGSKAILLHEVVGGGALTGGGTSQPDQVIPNTVPGAPLSGTEPLIRAYGLTTVTGSTAGNPLRGAVRFIQGGHGSLLQPSAATPEGLAATVEMQTQMVSFLLSGGQAVQVANPSVIRTQ
ncbi:MAG TPA: lipase [Xanthomonadales bacterium]|nr:lipase [Xanthomonadales bacterium]